jgi:hypothetical protein
MADESTVAKVWILRDAGLIRDQRPAPCSRDGYQEKVAIEAIFLSW